MKPHEFRAECVKLMPGYSWTVHKTDRESYITATGIQSSGFNRISTLHVIRTEIDGVPSYEVKSAGFGLGAKWLGTKADGTLARALRCLQSHYEAMESKYGGHARALQNARPRPTKHEATT